MKIKYKNLYTHFIFTTLHRLPLILEENRQRIEKYMTGIVNHHECKMYAIYANPEHVHFLVSRGPNLDEECLADLVGKGSTQFKMKTNSASEILSGRKNVLHFLYQKEM